MGTDPSEVLLTLAEIAVAFAGFSSVVAIFQRGTERGAAGYDRFRFWVMLEHSLAALLFSLLPFPLHFVGLADGAVWSACGLALVAFCVGHGTTTRYLAWRGHPAVLSSLRSWLTVLASTVYLAIVVSQVVNVLVWGRAFGPYLLGVFLLLFAAGVNFVLLLWMGGAAERT